MKHNYKIASLNRFARFMMLLVAFCSLGLAAHAQGSLNACTPDSVPQGYSGNLTVVGSAPFFRATAGINLRLIHTGGPQTYTFGTAPQSGAGWVPGFPAPTSPLTGAVMIPANAPVGWYNLEMTGFSGDNGQQNLLVTGNNLLYVYPLVGVQVPAPLTFSLAPNPASQNIKLLAANGNLPDDLKIRLMDIKGRVVQPWFSIPSAGQSWHELDLRDLPNGCYFVQLQAAGLDRVLKIMVQH